MTRVRGIAAAGRALPAAVLALGVLVAGPATARDDMKWRRVNPENLVFMELGEGSVVFELNPGFAPQTVARFRELVADDFYLGLSFYRVIDGFVAQGGDESDISQPNSQPALPPEFERPFDENWPWTTVQRNDLFAPETGFIDGFAAARDGEIAWLTHCPGVLAMARGNEPASGSTDFYIVIGQAPRYLDRNLTIFGRVIHGMDTVQRIRRGPAMQNGIIESDQARSRIRRMRLFEELAEHELADFYVMDTSSEGFLELLEARRNRSEAFFHQQPPAVLDVCQVPLTTRREKRGR